MTASDDPALAEVLCGRLTGLSAPGRWSVAAVAVAGERTGWWFSDATSSSAFHIGSVTKTVTALTLAVASLGGRVALDDRLDAYLVAAAGTRVRLVDLATHTAGYPKLPRELVVRSLRSPRDPYSCITDRSVDRALARCTRRHPGVGGKYVYSNFGYGVLGRALAVASRDSFFDLARAEVLEPLGLRETTQDLDPGPDRVAGHDASRRVVPDWHNAALAGCGCLWSTIGDVHRYLVANLHPDRTPIAGALRLVHTPRVAAGPRLEVGLGWHISATERGAVHWHNGGTSGFGSFVGFDPVAQVGVAVLMSRAHADDLDRVAMRVLADLDVRGDHSGRLAP